MKKFKVIFTDSKTGHDVYDNVVVEAEAMSAVARHLEQLQATFRLIEDVTNQYPSHVLGHCLRGNYIPEPSKV